MKTSNKILLVFFILVLASPFIMAKMLNRTLIANAYVLEKSNNAYGIEEATDVYKLPEGRFSVVKISGPAKGPNQMVKFNLAWADTASYGFKKREDSPMADLVCANDTLYINYRPLTDTVVDKNQVFYYTTQKEMWLNLTKEAANVVVEGASVSIHESGTLINPLMITLRHMANLTLGENYGAVVQKLPDVNVNSTDAELVVATNITMNSLEVDMKGAGSLTLNNSGINKVTGSISDSTVLTGNAKNFRSLFK